MRRRTLAVAAFAAMLATAAPAAAQSLPQQGCDPLDPAVCLQPWPNDFFTRALKPGARPIDPAPDAIVSPVDGTLSQRGGIHDGKILQAKGQNYTLAELLARFVAKSLPEIATIVRSVSDRDGKVYLDYLQNGHGRLLVSPFCVRPLPGAPVSMPIDWELVNGKLKLERFTIR